MKCCKKNKFCYYCTGMSIFMANCNSQPIATPNFGKLGSVIWSPNGKFIATVLVGSEIYIWDVKTGKLLRECKGYFPYGHSGPAVFSNNEKKFAYCGEKETFIIDLSNGTIRNYQIDPKEGIDFSADSKYLLISSSPKKTFIFGLESSFDSPVFVANTNYSRVKFDRNDKYLYTAKNNKIVKWNFKDGISFKKEKVYSFPKKIENFDVSPDSKFLAVSIENKENIEIIVHNLVKNEKIKKIIESCKWKGTTAFSQDGKYLTYINQSKGTYYYNTENWTYHRFDSKNENVSPNGLLKYTYNYDDKYTVSQTKDNKVISVIYENKPRFVNSVMVDTNFENICWIDHLEYGGLSPLSNLGVDFGKISISKNELKLFTEKERGTNVKFKPNENVAFISKSSDKNYIKFDLETEKYETTNIKTGNLVFSNNYEFSVVDNGQIEIYKKNTLLKTLKLNFDNGSDELIISNDGKYIAWTSAYGKPTTLNIVDVNSEKKTILNFEISSLTRILFSNDNKYLVFDAPRKDKIYLSTTYFYNIENGNIEKEFEHFVPITFSKTTDNILLFNQLEKKTHIVSAKTWNNVYEFDTYSAPSGGIFISHDDKYIFCATGNSLQIWDYFRKKLILTLYILNNSGDWLAYTPYGRFDGTEEGIKMLHYVDGMEIIPLESLYEKFYTPNLMARVLSGEEFAPVEVKIQDLKPKPDVQILNPQNNHTAASNQITVSVQVTDMGGGIDEILLYHNGKLVQTTNRGFKPVETSNDKKTKVFTLTIANGTNTIRATAFNNQRTEAIPDEIIVNYTGATVSKSNLHVLIIGIDNYKNPQYKLNYATADALAFKSEIEKGSKDIFGTVNITYLSDANTSKSAINSTFGTLTSTVRQNDVFLMYYAGHGVMSVENKPQFYIAPYDVTQLYGDNKMLQDKAVSAEELRMFSMSLKAQKQLYIFDACQSGGMTEMLAARGAAEEKAIALLARSTGTYWFTASGSEQFATEFAQLGHGVYTYALLQGLQGQADSGSKDKQITVQELDVFIKNRVPELSEKHKGQAQYPKSYGGGDDFPVIIVK